MRRSDQDSTRIVRTWLVEGSSQLSPRVHDAVLREFPGITQDGAVGAWRLRMAAYATAAIAAVAVVLLMLVGLRLAAPSGGAGPGAGATASPTPEGEATATPDADGNAFDCETGSVDSWEMPTPPMGVGLVGFPAEGAEPSLPSIGEQIDSYWVLGGGRPYRGMARLYADGRLIWNYANLPDDLPGNRLVGTGYIEQRLTRAGVGLVLREENLSRKDPMVLNYCLPSSAWADQTFRPYVPTNYAACLSVQPSDGSRGVEVALEAKLAMLPALARDLLEGSDLAPLEEDSYGPVSDCLALTLEGARALDAALQDAGFVPGWDQEEWSAKPGTVYFLDVVSGQQLVIFFEPVFPHGRVGSSHGG